MKHLIIISLFLISFNSFTQSKWSFGVEAFPNYTIMTYQSDGTFPNDEDFWKDYEIGKFCFSQQFYTSYKINEKSSVSLGIGYHKTGQRTKEMKYIYGNIDPRRGFVANDPNDPAIPAKSQFYYNHHNIQLPILYSFNFSKLIYIRGGLNTIFNISNTQTHYFTDQGGNENKNTIDYNSTNFRKVNLSARLGVGFNILNREKFRLYAQPSLEKSFLGLSKNASLNRLPLSFGVGFGVQIF